MSSGVAIPVVPVANDIVLGECKLYGNYGLANELNLGALSGGLKLTIGRKIKEIKFDGGYGFYLDSNGVPLRRYEEFTAKFTTESLCLKYENKKVISNAETTDTWVSKDWAGTGGTYAAETTIKQVGEQSAKCTADTNSYGIHNVFTVTKDLTVFDNGETATTADYIAFGIYLTAQDITDLGTANIRLSIHKDAAPTVTNLYYYDILYTSLVAGWNNFKVAKSAFTQTGSASWSAVTGISFKLSAAPSAEVVFYVDNITLLQVNTKSTILPLNGANFSMTDEGDYRKIVGKINIEDADYYDNIAIVGTKHDGKLFVTIISDVFNDGQISLALKEKTEVVNGTEFTGHYRASTATTPPIVFRDYLV